MKTIDLNSETLSTYENAALLRTYRALGKRQRERVFNHASWYASPAGQAPIHRQDDAVIETLELWRRDVRRGNDRAQICFDHDLTDADFAALEDAWRTIERIHAAAAERAKTGAPTAGE